MTPKSQGLAITPGRWFAWEMLPGYFNTWFGPRYYSPIRVNRVEPRKKGNNRLFLDFYNVCYAPGVKRFEIEVEVVLRKPGYLICDLHYMDRSAIITNLTLDWLKCHFPDLVRKGIKHEEDIHPVLMRHFCGPNWQEMDEV